MSKIRPKKADAKEIFQGFGGIASSAANSKKGLCEVQNLRILSDGSLQKRQGYRTAITLPGTVRGVWEGGIDGITYRFAVSGGTVYNLTSGTPTAAGSLGTTVGNVRFFLYRNRLYLSDGSLLYVFRYALSRFTEAQGYAPLYGVNWHPTSLGEVNEPLNQFSHRLRIHYLNTAGATVFRLPYYAASIDAVRVDGVKITDFTLSATCDSITIPKVGGTVEIAMTMALDGEDRGRIAGCRYAYGDRLGTREVLMLYGAAEGHRLFCAANVSDSMLGFANVLYDDTDPLYFVASEQLLVGDPQHPITAIYRDQDRYLVFYTNGAYAVSVSESDRTVEAYPLLHGTGCTLFGLHILLKGNPLIINESGIFVLRSVDADTDAFIFDRIECDIPDLKKTTFLRNGIVAYVPSYGELWLRDTTRSDGTVWVWGEESQQWYAFVGIRASFFWEMDDVFGFANQNTLAVFDAALFTDNNSPIVGSLTTGALDFGSPEETKRHLRVALTAQAPQDGEMTVTLMTERREKTLDLSYRGTSSPLLLDARCSVGRFQFVRVKISDTGKSTRFFRLALYANR